MSDESTSPRTVAAHDSENTERLPFEGMIDARLSVTRHSDRTAHRERNAFAWLRMALGVQ